MLFLSFEGIDGSGKSTQADRLLQRLEAEGYRTLLVREPGGTPLSERIRTLLLDPSVNIEPRAELLLFSAARAQLVSETIRPALESGTIVIADRFIDSTTAYQGGGRGLEDLDWMRSLHRSVTGGLIPDRTFYFVIDPETAQRRRQKRYESDGNADRMERASTEFFNSVAIAYNRIAEAEPDRIRSVDATRTEDEIGEDIWNETLRLIHDRSGTGAQRFG